MELSKKPLRVSHHCFFTDFYYCWLHLFVSSFAFAHFTSLGFSSLFLQLFLFLSFYFTNFLYYDCFFVRHFVFVLLYCKCYRFETTLFTLMRFLPHTPSPHLPQYRNCYGFKRPCFILKLFSTLLSFPTLDTTCFYQGFLGASSSSLLVAWPPTEVWNTDPAHLFVWITQCL